MISWLHFYVSSSKPQVIKKLFPRTTRNPTSIFGHTTNLSLILARHPAMQSLLKWKFTNENLPVSLSLSSLMHWWTSSSRCLGYINNTVKKDCELCKVHNELENATKAQATVSGSTVVPVKYNYIFGQLKTHAKDMDSANVTTRTTSPSTSPNILAVHAFWEFISSHGESSWSNGQYSATIKISSFSNLSSHKVSVTLDLAESDEFSKISELELCRVVKAAWNAHYQYFGCQYSYWYIQTRCKK